MARTDLVVSVRIAEEPQFKVFLQAIGRLVGFLAGHMDEMPDHLRSAAERHVLQVQGAIEAMKADG